MATNWSTVEVEAVVSDYFAMLSKELREESYNKTAHRRALLPLLSDRSEGSIERKHQNISAILIELGYPYISGYKPLRNYQQLLAEVVSARLDSDGQLEVLVQTSVETSVSSSQTVDNILKRLVDAPQKEESHYDRVKEPVRHISKHRRINYLEREAHNASLGLAGERFVLQFERARLHALGKSNLADNVEHVPSTEGDGAGFDIRSFEDNGSDRLIEVKTTAYGKQTPIFVSANEVQTSLRQADRYHLYRVFHFHRDPRLFTMQGAFEQICNLEATQFRGIFS